MKLQEEFDEPLAEMLLSPKCDMFKGTDGDCYITVDSPHGKVTLPLDSEGGGAVITGMFHEQEKHILTVSEKERGERLAYAKIYWKPQRPVFLRVGRDETYYYLDLQTQPKVYVRFNADGWQLVDSVPVAFREGQGQLPMPIPLKSDTFAEKGFDLLRYKLLRVSDAQWRVLLPLLVSYLLPDIQRPLLLLTGEQNSGKSTFLEIVKTLIDPNIATIGGDVPDERNLFIKVNSTWLPTFDNLSRLDDRQQDALCRIVTGGTYEVRRLYTDKGMVTITCKNPLILSGITNVANRGDLASRAVLFHLESIDRAANLISSEALTARLKEASPLILSNLLNLTCKVLKEWKSISAPARVRPASYGTIGLAVEQAYGWHPGSFEASYHLTRQSLEEDVVENKPVIQALLQYLEPYKAAGEHEINPGELLGKLQLMSDESLTRSNMWPKTPATFAKDLARCAPALRKQYGWDAEMVRDMHKRSWKFTYREPVVTETKREVPAAIKLAAQKLAPPRESLGKTVRRIAAAKKKGGKK